MTLHRCITLFPAEVRVVGSYPQHHNLQPDGPDQRIRELMELIPRLLSDTPNPPDQITTLLTGYSTRGVWLSPSDYVS